jgi:hypothetical protein
VSCNHAEVFEAWCRRAFPAGLQTCTLYIVYFSCVNMAWHFCCRSCVSCTVSFRLIPVLRRARCNRARCLGHSYPTIVGLSSNEVKLHVQFSAGKKEALSAYLLLWGLQTRRLVADRSGRAAMQTITPRAWCQNNAVSSTPMCEYVQLLNLCCLDLALMNHPWDARTASCVSHARHTASNTGKYRSSAKY